MVPSEVYNGMSPAQLSELEGIALSSFPLHRSTFMIQISVHHEKSSKMLMGNQLQVTEGVGKPGCRSGLLRPLLLT